MVSVAFAPSIDFRSLVAGLCATAGLTACSPDLNWREFRPAGTGLLAQWPCRPSEHTRTVVLAGLRRDVRLLSCQAGEATWGLAWTEGVEPGLVESTLIGMRQAAWANVGAQHPRMEAYAVPGAIHQAQAGRAQSAGQRPDGSPVSQDMVLFARGMTVFQATVLAAKPQAAAADEFFSALRFAP